MKLLLCMALACGLIATQSPTYENTDFYYEGAYPKDSVKSDLQKRKGVPKWVGKTCAVTAVSVATFALFTLQACFGSSSSPYKPFVAAGIAGAATYAWFELSEDL